MTNATMRLIRSPEVAMWYVLGKKVRSRNISTGKRRSWLERKLGVDHELPQKTSDAPVSKTCLDRESSIKGRKHTKLPAPFYGLAKQEFLNGKSVYTCVVGDRHMLENHACGSQGHVVFSDHDLRIDGWEMRPIMYWDANPKLITLFHKYSLVNFVPDGTKLIWLDSRVEIQDEVAEKIFDLLDTHELCVFGHYERNCVYEETLAILKGGRATHRECEEFSAFIRNIQFPRNGGLFETGVMGSRVTPRVRKLFSRVFAICHRYVPRDQLSLPIALADTEVDVHVFNHGETNLRNTPGVTVKLWDK